MSDKIDLPPLDVDSESAQLIARRARENLGKGPPKRRIVEGVIVALFVASFLAWAIYKVLSAY